MRNLHSLLYQTTYLPILLLLLSFTGNAAASGTSATVVGNLISWPDDGAYEVRHLLSGELICKGGLSCFVADGHYRVSSIVDGDTFTQDVAVGDVMDIIIDQSNFELALNVTNKTITWAIDGWYQVQNANTYETICEGTNSCTVPDAGWYQVINHTLGLKYELEVTDKDGPRVNNSTVSWPLNGWYQVKNAYTGNLVCEGVGGCGMADGSYLVSRLYIDGGTTWPIEVNTRSNIPAPKSITITNNTIAWPDVGRYEVTEELSGEIVCKGGTSCTVPDGIYFINSYFEDGSSGGSRHVIGDPEKLTIDQDNFEYALKVDDLTINWALEGWYQVLDAKTYEDVCSSTEFCVVPKTGRYIVINHSYGYRTELEICDTSGPTVTNNTISWPDNGWYRVRNLSTGNVVCDGVDACSQASGTYSVSRLFVNGGTTWTVVLGDPGATSSKPTVKDNVISWPDDGWYQVENRLTGQIVCQGGLSCTVEDGIYWVLRFYEGGNSGVRIEVGSPDELAIDPASFVGTLNVSDRTIDWSVDGWYQVQDANTYLEICNGDNSCTVPNAGQYFVINHTLGLRAKINIE